MRDTISNHSDDFSTGAYHKISSFTVSGKHQMRCDTDTLMKSVRHGTVSNLGLKIYLIRHFTTIFTSISKRLCEKLHSAFNDVNANH